MEQIRVGVCLFHDGKVPAAFPVYSGIDCTGPLFIEDQRIDIEFTDLAALKHPRGIFQTADQFVFIKRGFSPVSADKGVTPELPDHISEMGSARREHPE